MSERTLQGAETYSLRLILARALADQTDAGTHRGGHTGGVRAYFQEGARSAVIA